MRSKFLITFFIALILILGVASLLALDSIKNNSPGSKDLEKQDWKVSPYNKPDSSYQTKNSCGNPYQSECFSYPKIKNTKTNIEYPILEKTRLAPCAPPKKVCKLCSEKLPQVRSDGHSDSLTKKKGTGYSQNLVKTRINC